MDCDPPQNLALDTSAVEGQDLHLTHREPMHAPLLPMDASGNCIRIQARSNEGTYAHRTVTHVGHPPATCDHQSPCASSSTGVVSLPRSPALLRYCEEKSDKAIFARLAFPKVVPRAPRVQGRWAHKACVENLRTTLRKFLEGRLDLLKAELMADHGPEGHDPGI